MRNSISLSYFGDKVHRDVRVSSPRRFYATAPTGKDIYDSRKYIYWIYNYPYMHMYTSGFTNIYTDLIGSDGDCSWYLLNTRLPAIETGIRTEIAYMKTPYDLSCVNKKWSSAELVLLALPPLIWKDPKITKPQPKRWHTPIMEKPIMDIRSRKALDWYQLFTRRNARRRLLQTKDGPGDEGRSLCPSASSRGSRLGASSM